MDWIKCITNRLLRAARREAGITLIETVFAIAIFGIVSTSVIGVLTSATAADGRARQKTIALELAQQQVEYIRQLRYAYVCIVGGNPSCPPDTAGIAATQDKWVLGLRYRLTTSIRWVNDAVPTGVATAANYKRVRVTVSRVSDNKQLARVYTYVSNPSRANMGGINNAIINVSVLDYGYTTASASSTTVVQGAQVDLWDGPSGHVSDVTDETGMVTFASLTPNPTSGATAYYDILASLTGYQTLREFRPPGTVPSGTGTGPVTAAHLQIGPSQTQGATIYLYRPATINVQVQVQDADENWIPYTAGTANVYIGASSPRGAQMYSTLTGSLQVGPPQAAPNDMIGGEQPVSGASYTVGAQSLDGTLVATSVRRTVPDNYPAILSSTFIVQLQAVTYKSCTVTVKKSSTAVPNARVDVIDGTGGTPVQAYLTGTTNSSGQVVFKLPVTSDYDIKAWGTSGGSAVSGGLTDQVVPNNLPSSGLCNFAVSVS